MRCVVARSTVRDEVEGIWAVLRERLDYASFVPRLVPDIERAELRRRDGSTYYVLKNPRGERGAGLYVRLEPEDLRLVDLVAADNSGADSPGSAIDTAGASARAHISAAPTRYGRLMPDGLRLPGL